MQWIVCNARRQLDGRARRSSTMSDMTDQLAYTADEAAKALSVSRASIYNLMASGALRSVKLGKSRRIPVEAVRELLTATASRPSPRQGRGSRTG
jgi:excisionase family DNA binding protein